jgi:hypothetical protein
MKTVMAPQAYEVAYQDLVKLFRKHADKMSPAEMLAVAANLVGKILAMQNQRTMTREKALEILMANIEIGNKQAVDELAASQGGHA